MPTGQRTSAAREWLMRRSPPRRWATLINKSTDAQENRTKPSHWQETPEKQARGAVDEAMASAAPAAVYLRAIRLFATSHSCAKTGSRSPERQKSWQAERYARGTLRKIFERLDRTDGRWLTPGYRSLAGRERPDDLLYLPQLNKHQIQTLATHHGGDVPAAPSKNSAMALARLMVN